MANQEYLDLLEQGVDTWNKWKIEHSKIQVDLSEAYLPGAGLAGVNFDKANLSRALLMVVDFRRAILIEADLSEANLRRANLSGAYMNRANLSKANLNKSYLNSAGLSGANLSEVDLSEADLSFAHLDNACLRGADLSKAIIKKTDLSNTDLSQANLSEADLNNANLSGANLNEANLSKANLSGANLNDSFIYAISAWDIQLEGTLQSGLIITKQEEPTITVDNLEVAQFIYLLLNNKKIRDVIDTITSKVVLILGRFTSERKVVLDAIRDELRKRNYTPVLFDFEKPTNRDLTETVSTLAHLARFIIVDLTDPSSAPHEVATIIPHCIVPVQPLLTLQPHIIEEKVVERREYAMFQDLRRRYSWVLPTFRYQDTADLLTSIKEHIIEPAEQKVKELAQH